MVYGNFIVLGWNNLVTATVLEGAGSDTQAATNVSDAIQMLATNYSTVFGDTSGSQGIAYLLKHQIQALENTSITTLDGTPLITAYARALATTMKDNVEFTIELMKAVTSALT